MVGSDEHLHLWDSLNFLGGYFVRFPGGDPQPFQLRAASLGSPPGVTGVGQFHELAEAPVTVTVRWALGVGVELLVLLGQKVVFF